MRRCQQFEVYAAEALVVAEGRTFDDPTEMTAWVNAIRDTAWFAANFPNVRYIEIAARDNRRRESVGGFVDGVVYCEQLRVHYDALSLCHEVAHGLARARYSSRSHDPWFARIYLELVYLLVGSDAYAALRRSFESHGVEHDPGPEFHHVPEGVRVA